MTSDLQATKSPLFVPMDEQQALNYQPVAEEQLDSIQIQIPISLVLLEALQQFTRGNGSLSRVNALLEAIVKNEEFLFQDIPVVYEPTGGLLSLVPDDNQTYQINWKSLILQAHVSFLQSEGWDLISVKKKQASFKSDDLPQQTVKVGSQIGSRAGTSMGMGSLARRQQISCVASFSDRRFGTLSQSNIGSLSLAAVPQLEREEVVAQAEEVLPPDYDIQQILTFTVQCGMQNLVFRALVAAVVANGLLDYALGNLLIQEYQNEIAQAELKVKEVGTSTTAFEGFYAAINNAVSLNEQQINVLIEKDQVTQIFEILGAVNPTYITPHARNYCMSVLGPLCYHENAVAARQAAQLYSNFVAGNSWDPQTTKISTVKTAIKFQPQGDNLLLICEPTKNGRKFLSAKPGSYTPTTTGFYEICYAHLTSTGEYEIEKTVPPVRYIILPSTARKEVIHELPAFDNRGPVQFEELSRSLDELSQCGVTAVHVAGAIATLSQFRITHVTDHTVINKACGGIEEFKKFCAHAKKLNMRVLIDFEPLVSIMMSSRKYSPFQTLYVDDAGRLVTVVTPNSDLQLLNLRSTKLWELLAQELKQLAEIPGVSGFFLGDVTHWDYVLPRNLNELQKIDPDDQPHYGMQNILVGSVVDVRSNNQCGLLSRQSKRSPFLVELLSRLWQDYPDMFVFMQADKEKEAFVMESGIIPQNDSFTNLITNEIINASHNEDFNNIYAAKAIKEFIEDRQRRLPEGYLFVSIFGSMQQGLSHLPVERYQLMVDFLFFHTDVPLTGLCLNQLQALPYAYDITRKPTVTSYYAPSAKFCQCLKTRAASRQSFDFLLGGSCDILPVTYNHQENRSIVATIRIAPDTNRCALITSSFYSNSLIFEATINKLPIFKDIPQESIIEIVPLLPFSGQASTNSDKPQYYAYSEAATENSSLFFDIYPYATNAYEIRIKRPPIEGPIRRTLMEHVFTRLDLALQHNSIAILNNNDIMLKILNVFEPGDHQEEFNQIIESLPTLQDAQPEVTFREALFFATRYQRRGGQLVELTEAEDALIAEREKTALSLLKTTISSKNRLTSDFAELVHQCNVLGPVFFVAPELGPFSKVGGLSTMVWDLVKDLAVLGVDVSVISPYYNVGLKGETNYLKKYGIEFDQCIDVYAPDKYEIGIHYGVVDGVKLWFMHNYQFFATPYPTGSTSYRLQLLCVMAKASLELLCQKRIIPSLIVTNDWMTGLVPTYARQTFGNVFSGTKFLHIFHNLGIGYAGKVYPNDGNTGALHYIHNLPDELIVDNFDHSFDPSLSALLMSDQWATVSKKYRDELLESSPYNYFLRGYPKPFAYSNGIRFQDRLDALAKLNMNHDEAKAYIQKKYFGESDPSKCLFVFVGRIVEQKGVHLITDSFEELNRQYDGKIQVIVGGKAEPDDRTYGAPVSAKLWDLRNRYPHAFWADPTAFFTDGLACCQGCDYFLIPSQFEPSGIVQQEAFASHTPCIAFRTGGLADTVFEFDREKKTGNGLLFWAHRHKDFEMAIDRALKLYQDKDLYNIMRENAFKSVLTTEIVAKAWAREFARLFNKIFEEDHKDIPRTT